MYQHIITTTHRAIFTVVELAVELKQFNITCELEIIKENVYKNCISKEKKLSGEENSKEEVIKEKKYYFVSGGSMQHVEI